MRTWLERDLVVLRYLHENPADGGFLSTELLRETDTLEMSEHDFIRAVETLGDADYVTWGQMQGEGGGGVYWTHFQVTDAGMQALGEWPAFEALGDPPQLGAVLDRLAAMAQNDEEEGNIEAVATRVKKIAPDMLRAIAVGAVQTLARHVA